MLRRLWAAANRKREPWKPVGRASAVAQLGGVGFVVLGVGLMLLDDQRERVRFLL